MVASCQCDQSFPQLPFQLFNLSWRHPSSKKRPPPGRRSSLKSLCLNLQLPLSRLLLNPTRKHLSVKTVAAKPTTNNLVVTPQPTTSPLEDISDLDNLPLQACVELTHQLLTPISSLPTEVAHPRAVLKTFILFMAEYGSTP
jgi:hypothetical protein